jgi:hypothetical protein
MPKQEEANGSERGREGRGMRSDLGLSFRLVAHFSSLQHPPSPSFLPLQPMPSPASLPPSSHSFSLQHSFPPPPPPPPPPICLICLETLLPEDFESGEAIALECGCRGDVRLRHLACAIEWNNVSEGKEGEQGR